MHPAFTGITERIPQNESQSANYIIPVLEYILKHHEFSVKELEDRLKISRDSIDRTIKILLDRNLIGLEKIKERGKKFYKVKSEEAIKKYYENLFRWKHTKKIFSNQRLSSMKDLGNLLNQTKKIGKQLSVHLKRSEQSVQVVTPALLSKPLQLGKTAKPISIRDMPHSKASKILRDYSNNSLCDVCWKENKVIHVIEDAENAERVCEYGHSERIPPSTEGDSTAGNEIFGGRTTRIERWKQKQKIKKIHEN